MTNDNKFSWIYKLGFLIILALPILTTPPYFFPADWGKSIVFRSIMAVIMFLFCWQILYKNGKVCLPSIKNNKIIWALAAFFIIFLLATVFSADPLFSLWGSPYRGGGFVTFAFCFVFSFLTFVLFKKEHWKKAWIFSIIIGILVSLVAIIQYYGLFNKIFSNVSSRPFSTMGNPILLAIYLVLLFFITLAFAIKEKFSWKKLAYFLILFLFAFVILLTGSRAAYLGTAIGGLYFLLFYPTKSSEQNSAQKEFSKKIKIIKISIACLIILAAGFVFYANATKQYPQFLKQNKLFKLVEQRLSFDFIKQDPRFAAWKIELNILKSKPLLGYGPENFSVGFDKHYDPSIPYLNTDVGWWDRAHNILLDIGVQAGILAVIIYLTLFAVLLWSLRKIKSLEAHSVQATLIGYLVANFFSFDSFSTYLIFFMLIGYSMHLIYGKENTPMHDLKQRKSVMTTLSIGVLLLTLAIFLWQYNLVPLQINAEINKASTLANKKQCDKALALMDKTLKNNSFLNSYARMEYVEFTKTCSNFYPDKNLSYVKKDLELISEAVKTQPLYTRYWLFLGNSTTSLIAKEKDISSKDKLISQASYYFNKASQLAPKHQETLVGQAKLEIAKGDYKKAKSYSEKCIALNPSLGDCYWALGLSQIYSKNVADAKKNIESAHYDLTAKSNLDELSDAYGSILDYQNLAPIYEKLILINPNFAQYHSSLAFFYKELGRYAEAKQEALKVLQLSPQSKPNVDAFLKTLP